MKATPFLVLITVAALAQAAASGQTADQFIAAGRLALASRNMTNANGDFAAAVTVAPDHPVANTFYAATRLLSLANKPAGTAFLDRLGVSQTNRDVYHWRTSLPRDTNGVPVLPAGMSASELTAFLRTNVLPAITASGANLAKVTDPSFTLSLTAAETTSTDLTLDYGDILLLRAGLHFAEYLAYTINSWNLDAQLTELRSLLTSGTATPESFLAQFPELFTFATTNDLTSARQAFSDAAALYIAASDFIRARPTNVTRLFNYDPEMAPNEASFRTTLTELTQSLNGPVVLTLKTNLTVNLAQQFSPANPLRRFFPEFADKAIIAGSLPDATFGGLIRGIAPDQVEGFLGSRHHVGSGSILGIPFVSQFRVPQRLSDGRFQIALNALDGAFFVIQGSTDLAHWTDLAAATVEGGVLAFDDSSPDAAVHRFYRAVDRSNAVTANGTVFDISTLSPIPDAVVSLSFPFPFWPGVTNQTDGSGSFFVLTTVPPDAYVSYQLDVSAAGYSPFQYSGFSSDEPHLTLPVYLAPPGFHPANDDFAQRQVLQGASATVAGFNVGATSESGEPVQNWGGKSVWWSWTAPADGAVSIDTSGSWFETLLAVYTGNSLSQLTPLAGAAGSASAVNFFVSTGVTYQIAVDGLNGGSGSVTLNLHTVPPTLPRITDQPEPQTVLSGDYAYFGVSAVGTAPLSYQWFKDGTPIQDATDAYYWISPVQLSDAGSYSVVVRNAAGTAASVNAALTVQPPPRFAPASLTNKIVTWTEDWQSVGVTFSGTGDTFTEFEPGTANALATGTYQYTRQGANSGQLVLTSTDTTGAANQVTYILTFTSATAGTYTYTTSGGQTGSGTFSNLHEVSAGNAGGNTGGNTGGVGTAPTSLAGKIIDFTATGLGNERLSFSTDGQTVTSDAVAPPNNVATCTYTASGSTGTLVVTFPNGDNYNLTMSFTDNAHGTWSGIQHFDNSDHSIPAGSWFTIQNP
jgi:Immunoglobulin I-set domain